VGFLFVFLKRLLQLAVSNSATSLHLHPQQLFEKTIWSAPGPKHCRCRWSHIPWESKALLGPIHPAKNAPPEWSSLLQTDRLVTKDCMSLTNSTKLYCSVKIWLSLKIIKYWSKKKIPQDTSKLSLSSILYLCNQIDYVISHTVVGQEKDFLFTWKNSRLEDLFIALHKLPWEFYLNYV